MTRTAERCVALLLGLLLIASAASAEPARLVLIIDDLGDNLELGQQAAQLPAPLTLAILPHTRNAVTLAELGHRNGKDVLVHAPMSNHGGRPLGPGALTSGMDRATFVEVLQANLAAVPHARGLNNHMGSLLTEQVEPMSWLMAELHRSGLFFIDSRTSRATVAERQADVYGVPHLRRHVFLDNQRDETTITEQFHRLLALAKQRGLAVGIGHPYPETLAVLQTELPKLAEHGVEIVSASSAIATTQPPCPARVLRRHNDRACDDRLALSKSNSDG